MQTTALKGFNLSLQQARLWPFQQKSNVYRVQCAVQLDGELDTVLFLRAIQRILQRHAILRTAFYCMPGMDVPLQIVDERAEVVCPVISLEGLPEEIQTMQVQRCFSALLTEEFDLTRSPLICISLLRLFPCSSVLLMGLPALCADDATLSQYIAELSDAYAALLYGEQLTDEPLQYVDVAAWQDELLQSESVEAQHRYWHELDLSHVEVQPLPLLRGGQEPHTVEERVDTFSPRMLDIPVEQAVSTQVQAWSEQHGVSPEAYLLTCWQAVLWHLVDAGASIIGVGCDGRIAEELNRALGLYARYVPFLAPLAANVPFDQAVVFIGSELLQVVEDQVYFTWEASEGTQSSRALRFFPICFDYTCWPAQFEAGPLRMSLDQHASCIERFVLKLSVLQSGPSLRLELQYDPAYYSDEQAQRIAEAVQVVLQESAERSQTAIGSFSLLHKATQTSLLQTYCATTTVRSTQVLHQLFEAQAILYPQHTAVISGEEQLTYEELNARANQLAHLLRQRAIGPDVCVGLCLPRSVAMLVSLLATLKAGGAYVPLDPESPPARLAYQLQDAQVSVLLTERSLLARFSAWHGTTLCLEDLQQEIVLAPQTNPAPASTPENLAYIMYTSGSTGLPKGVMVSQQNVVNYTLAVCELLASEPGWHYATVSTLAADLGNTAIFCALASGGCIQILDYETITSGETFARWHARHPIDVLKIVPSHLSALLVSEQNVLPQRALLLGGEAFPLNLLARLRTLQGTCRVFNHYGPTETTIGVLVNALSPYPQTLQYPQTGHSHEEDLSPLLTPPLQYPQTGLRNEETLMPPPMSLGRGDGTTNIPNRSSNLALGRPIANLEAYVLGWGYQILPVGAVGELCIGGAGLTLGYLHQPERTAERFVPHPFSTRPGARLYRTGDLAYYTPAGLIEFVGRRDSQVKVRGFRIELGEIEAALRRHSNVWDAVVALREDISGDPYLVGYIVARTLPAPTEEALRAFLREYVPEHMLPSQCVVLDALPLTKNGKVDRKKLPEPGPRQQMVTIPLVYPRSPIEEILVAIWKELLSISTLGIYHNFFSLGGHSLLATQLIARVRMLLQVELPLRSLFEAPTIAQLAQRIEQALSANQKLDRPPLLPMVRTTDIPLSFAQQRLWFLYQLEPESTAYLLPRAWRFRGSLDAAALERSLSELIQRHEVLRTTFQMHDGQPVQVIHPVGRFCLPLVDLTGLATTVREHVAQTLFSQEAQRPCDLELGQVLRTTLLRLSEVEQVLLLTMHHIISDAWSNGIFEREMTQLYQAFLAGQPSPLSPLPLQYADFSVWQRQWLQGEVLEAQLAYWRQHLAGVTPLELPTDKVRPVVQTLRGALQSLHLPLDLLHALQMLSQREGVTLFMLLLAAFQALLARITGQVDISVGTPIANRIDSQLEGLIGFFVNTLVMRTDLSGNPSFVDMLARVREVALGAYSNQDVPFELLVEELKPVRNLGQTPLFQVVFSLQQTEGEEGSTGLQLHSLATEHTTSKFDLTFNLLSDRQGLHCFLEYSIDLFEAATIHRFLEHWHVLLEGLVTDPQARLADLPLLSVAERQKLLFGWNDTRTDYPQTRCVHDFFAAQAVAAPDAVALVLRDEHITYHVLHARSNQLAWYLRELGIGVEMMVGVCLERSIDLLISLLGILKAGGCFVPLDASYPHERLSFMLEDTSAQVLLTHSSLLARLPASRAQTICLDIAWQEIAQHVSDNLTIEVSPHHLAYVMYTSGSTGRPKGVAVTHQNIVRLVKHTTYARFAPDEIFLLFAPTSFDASTFEIWGALLNGARLILFPPLLPSLAELGQVLRLYQVTTLWLTAGLFHQMIDTQLEALASLRQLLAGGDVLLVSHVQRALQELSGCRLINGYGPTEGTTFTCCYPMVSADQVGDSVSIGRPIANTQVYVLDAWYNPVPIGAIGELYIGGAGLARGYLNRPELTAERFVPHPFSEQAGARLYKTGDLVRYSVDGTLEFLGRADSQIKLRGFRIELGEIEAVLNEIALVRQCAVLEHKDQQGNMYLVAYIVSDIPTDQLTRELRPIVQQRLPEYMVPAFFVSLQELPLNPNGKVDRHALSVPDGLSGEGEEDTAAPRTPIEELLAELWCEVLHRKRVGAFDDFFALGGHSLLATRLVARIQALLHINVPLLWLFEAPTIASLARKVEQELHGYRDSEVSLLLPASRSQDLPLSFAQQRLWFLYQLDPLSTAYSIPSAQRLLGSLNAWALEKSLDELLRRHESLRTTFQIHGGQPVQLVSPAARFCLPVVDLRGLHPETRLREARRLVQQERHRPFDLERGSLLRAHLLRLAEEEHMFLVTMHHIVADGWSMQVLVRDVTQLYRAFVLGQPSSLPPLPIQYADYALWQRQWLQGEVLAAQLQYWKEQLGGASSLDLATDYPRPAQQTYRGASESVLLATSLRERLLALSQHENVTLFMLLLAAFQVLLLRYTEQDDISVGTPIANRTRAEVEDLIGFFVNTLVLRSDLSGNPTFRDLLGQVREVTLGAYAHQDVPFEYLVEALQPERDLSRPPLFQVMFGVQQVADEEEQRLEGLTVNSLGTEHTTTKFDITFNVVSSMRGLLCSVEYSTDLFASETMQRLLSHWQTLLEGIVAMPEQRVRSLPLLSPEQQMALLTQAQGISKQPAVQESWLSLFRDQVQRYPDAIAVVDEDGCLSYERLQQQANQVAWALQHLGVGPEVLVGLWVQRSIGSLIQMLAILKAGSGYVPLDPNYPQARLLHMLQQSQVALLLSQDEVPEPLCELVGRVLLQPQLQKWVQRFPSEEPATEVDPEQVAYVIYTSGSTGGPKGVLVTHRGLANLAREQASHFEVGASSHVLQFASWSFDASIAEMLVSLQSGGCLYLAAAQDMMPGGPLQERVRRWGISVITLPPSVLAVLPEGSLPMVETLVVAGEACSAEVATRWSGGRKFYNAYGPTEATVCASVQRCEGQEGRPGIGRPLGQTQCYVLDGQMQLVPPGVVGELYLGGIGLARGYVGRAEQTAERFVPHPYGQVGERLYRTGDRVKWLADGTLGYIGRQDQQVKLRGFRIELGEIEEVLRGYAGVREAVVVVREQEHLVAYVVGESGAGEEPRALLEGYLWERLPAYLVPGQLLWREELPRLPNGKVDRRRLQEESRDEGERTGIVEEPATEMEALVAQIWCEVLGDECIGIHENFFELGGHSLLATQIVARLQDVLQIELSVRSLFEAPTIATLAASIERALREMRQSEAPPLVPVARTEALPLSFAQQRLWFLDQLEPGSTAYLLPMVQRLQGPVQIRAMERSILQVVQRHEVLRTTFELRGAQPVQVIHPVEQYIIPVIDLQGLQRDERRRVARQLVEQEKQQPCDLAQGPLLRVKVMRVEAEEHVLLVTLHHSISDGWSNGIFWREVTTLYEAFVSGEPVLLPPLSIQYADYALWQRQWLQGEVLEQQLAYWKDHLAGCPPLELPTDFPRPALQTFQGAHQSVYLPDALRESLLELSRQQDVTLFMLLLAAFQVLLMRYSDQTDISVGTPVANRTRPELEMLIGFFINTLVIRMDLSGNPTFVELLARVREVALKAYAYQDVPFEQLVEALQPERDLSRSPLFQVMFNMQQGGATNEEAIGSDSVEPEQQHTTKFDLTFTITNTDQRLRCGVEYNTDLFAGETIRRMIACWQTLLQSIVIAPQMTISELPLLGEREQELLLHTWNPAPLASPEEQSLHAWISAQVRRTPDAIAVLDEQTHLSYQALERHSNQLAWLLQTRYQVGSETLVALCLPDSVLAVLALLAVLKAGGTYVPLDPTSPPERLQRLVTQLGSPLILTSSYSCQQLPQELGSRLVLDEEPLLSEPPTRQPIPLVKNLDQLAYVIFTSGSTGTPKGVAVSHRNVVHSTWARLQSYQQPVHSYLLLSPFFFDSSVAGLYWTLVQGGRLALAARSLASQLDHLPLLLQEQACSHLLTIPGLYSLLLDQSQPEQLASLRQVIVAGESCPTSLLERHRHVLPQSRFANEYGPTEGTVWCSLYQDEGEPLERSVPIGRPISSSQLYLLGRDGRLVPPGAVGEIYLAGAGVARGYLYAAGETAQRFVPHGWSEQPGARLYRTGDLGHYRVDGQLEYMGRADQQVKLRGHRIELGEIEALLNRQEPVQEAAVAARPTAGGEGRLVGYVVLQEPGTVSEQQMRAWVSAQVPDYMVPTHWVELEALPRTPTGKVDRKRLPEPAEQEHSERQAGTGEPLVEWVREIWQEVLGRQQVGEEENFFEIGGHSLLATQVIARIRSQIGKQIELRSMFEAPTVRGLARRVEQYLRGESAGSQEPELRARARESEAPLSYGQQRLWFIDLLSPRGIAYLIPSAQRLRGPVKHKALERSFQQLQQRHETLRTTFEVREQTAVQVIAEQASVRVPLIDVSGLEQPERIQQVRKLIGQEAEQPCDLQRGPLLRVHMVREDEQEQVLLVTLHHIIADGWSVQILERELAALYRANVQDERATLAPLPIQYADYALWQREWLTGEVLAAQLAYWRKQLAGVTPLQLPTDQPRPTVPGNRTAMQPFTFEDGLSSKLIALSRQEGVTLFMLFLATFQAFLSRYCKQDDIVVGTDVANRGRTEVEGLVGFFVNQLVLRSNLAGNRSFRTILQQVSQVALEAYAHQDVPFEKIVEELRLERSAREAPLFQVKFLLQDSAQELPAAQSAEAFPDVTITPLAQPGSALKLDLILNISRTAQGMGGVLIYNPDLFHTTTMERMAQRYVQFLHSICSDPDTQLHALEILTLQEKEHLLMQRKEQEATAFTKFKMVKPKPVSLRQETLITTGTLSPDEPLPFVIRPNQAELDIVAWAQNNQAFLEKELLTHGAILLRDFLVPTASEFERFALVVCSDLYAENGEHVPVDDVGSGNLYTPVFYAPEKKLLWHNENSFNATWPMKILFHCAKTAEQGGETPIVDSRKVYQRIDPAIREEFARKQIMYVRNYGEDLGLTWQKVFRTQNKADVEAYCRREAIDFAWKDKDQLKTWQVRPAVLQHPQTGEWIWWNQATHWHLACLDKDVRKSLQTLFSEENLPRTCVYGDGSAIADDVMDEISRVYQEAEVSFPWQVGDILLLDNMLTAHARNPFKGQRKIYVSLGSMMSLKDVAK